MSLQNQSLLINKLNGTILLIVFIDPKISILADDDVINQKGSYVTLKSTSIMIVTLRLLVTLPAQLLFPRAEH
ncbi:DUF2837 family protein [Lysinibacillus yapensis]|uniref:DUF2837 family protein n=1 Tax=Ureibacillus yapensis TaxID=2304605 RepID=A0A396S4L3_9BACL|nr:DUF2837 family protein [Lysinibacillus yapensis]RHW34086.1 DUF2837 family protein [Lysinibacillus yapensis]